MLFEILAYSIGFRYYLWLRKRTHDPISEEHRWWIFIGAALGGWAGSHLLGILEDPPKLIPFNWLRLLADKTVAGGLLGGLIGVESVKKYLGIRTSSGDLMTFPLLLAIGIGRIGCHLAGMADGTQGLPTTLPWGVDFGDGIPRHPTALYEIMALMAIATGLLWAERKGPLPNGWRFRFFMVGYLLWRLLVEFLKPGWTIPGLGLSSIQVAVLGGLMYYVYLFSASSRSPAASK